MDAKIASFTKFPRPELFPVKLEHSDPPYNVGDLSNQKAVSLIFHFKFLGNFVYHFVKRISKVREIKNSRPSDIWKRLNKTKAIRKSTIFNKTKSKHNFQWEI